MTKVQFFVRLLTGRTIVLIAHSTDTICSVLEMIQSRTGTPTRRQCLVYQRKQLQLEQTLYECGIDDDAELKLASCMGRVESISHPETWDLINNELVPRINSLCKKPCPVEKTLLKSGLIEFLLKCKEAKYADSHIEIFTTSNVPEALVSLYMSSDRVVVDDAIHLLVIATKLDFVLCVPIVVEICKFLGMSAGSQDPLYRFCRGSLREMVLEGHPLNKGLHGLHKIFPFAQELVIKISRDWAISRSDISLSLGDIDDFAALLAILTREIEGDPTLSCQIKVPFNEQLSRLPVCHKRKITYFRGFFIILLDKIDMFLKKFEKNMDWMWRFYTLSSYLTILKQLNNFSKLYYGCKEIFLDTMKQRKRAISYLILKSTRRSDDIEWIFDFKEVMEFEAKRHLTLMMLPEPNNNEPSFRMVIDRSHLLTQSFDYIAHAHPNSLRSGLFMMFKNETATGPGVLREWFLMVGEEIFNPQNALFVACPNDRRRFLPNPASKVNPGHLQYFRFCGRMIALALVRRIHVGIVLDRVFMLQLAGRIITLEDIQDADPYLYSSCKQILEMDADVVDQDALGLTFVHEIEEFGERKNVDLCVGGKSIAVNSKNRMQYVDSLIQHRFVTSISQQVEHFASGFADIGSPELQKAFFKFLDPEDLDLMLHGSENSISVDDWRAHTDYHGFKRTDSQISWFWETVGHMTHEQKKVLLFFWTSIKYVPVEGFNGLASRLHIHKTSVPSSLLPTSHTCFFQLCFPSYPSLSVTRDRLGIITQEHVGFSFGKS